MGNHGLHHANQCSRSPEIRLQSRQMFGIPFRWAEAGDLMRSSHPNLLILEQSPLQNSWLPKTIFGKA